MSDLLDRLYKSICLYPVQKGVYPNRLVLGANVYKEIVTEMKEHIVLGLTSYPNGTNEKLWDVPITVDENQRDIIELGYMESIVRGGRE